MVPTYFDDKAKEAKMIIFKVTYDFFEASILWGNWEVSKIGSSLKPSHHSQVKVKLSCDSRFQLAFTACNQGNFFENATTCGKRMRKTLVATQL